ncbi:hypothetical protein EB241_09140 [Erwinia psidii]|uniref:Uncharacterized protein n=1 Tax=Erwinia psidii TaxID=69224 RepID=A0A3N6RYY2_9GAMM|nr:hypothetical protein EB241_09140 [Erwinia psidii]
MFSLGSGCTAQAIDALCRRLRWMAGRSEHRWRYDYCAASVSASHLFLAITLTLSIRPKYPMFSAAPLPP